MRLRKRMLCAFAALLCLAPCFSFRTVAAVSGGQQEVRVPITLEVPYAVAGAEFEITYTSGLKLLSFEKSEVIQSASTTPVVEKNGKTYLGFYHGSNDFEPQDGVLDVGTLVFAYSGDPNQSVTVTEAKYVQVIDKDTTNSELLSINAEIAVPLASGAALQVGKQSSSTLWIVLAVAVIVLAAGGLFLYRRKTTGKIEAAPEATSTSGGGSEG